MCLTLCIFLISFTRLLPIHHSFSEVADEIYEVKGEKNAGTKGKKIKFIVCHDPRVLLTLLCEPSGNGPSSFDNFYLVALKQLALNVLISHAHACPLFANPQ